MLRTPTNTISQPWISPQKPKSNSAPHPTAETADYPLVITRGDEYDAYSIMHYTSDSYTGKKYDQITLENASLTMWKGAAPDNKPPEKVAAENSRKLRRSWNSKPSSKDIEGVKKLYPWTG